MVVCVPFVVRAAYVVSHGTATCDRNVVGDDPSRQCWRAEHIPISTESQATRSTGKTCIFLYYPKMGCHEHAGLRGHSCTDLRESMSTNAIECSHYLLALSRVSCLFEACREHKDEPLDDNCSLHRWYRDPGAVSRHADSEYSDRSFRFGIFVATNGFFRCRHRARDSVRPRVLTALIRQQCHRVALSARVGGDSPGRHGARHGRLETRRQGTRQNCRTGQRADVCPRRCRLAAGNVVLAP